MDDGNMCLNTHLDLCQHMRFHLRDVTPEIVEQHSLEELADENGWCCCEIRKAICGLGQSGALAAAKLAKVPEPEGYFQSRKATCTLHKSMVHIDSASRTL